MKNIDGLKTYAMAGSLVIYAISGLIAAQHDAGHAIELIIVALGGASLRHGVAKSK